MEKKPRYNVIISDRARQMLANHVRFLAEKVPRLHATRKTNCSKRYVHWSGCQNVILF